MLTNMVDNFLVSTIGPGFDSKRLEPFYDVPLVTQVTGLVMNTFR